MSGNCAVWAIVYPELPIESLKTVIVKEEVGETGVEERGMIEFLDSELYELYGY